jgi:hypothetical protein
VKAANLKARAFLKAFRVCANISDAAAAVPMDRSLHYRWLKESKSYAAAFERSKEQAAQTLEDECVERARIGVFVPNVWKGEFVLDENGKPYGTWQKSDQLLMFALKGARPDKYRERGLFEGKRGEPLAIAATLEIKVGEQKLKHLDDDELAALIAISRKFANADDDGGGTET